MKKILIYIFSALISLLMLAYVSYLFIVPNFVNFNTFIPVIQKNVYESTAIDTKFKDIKIKTSWDFKFVLTTPKIDFYNNNEKFMQINDFKVKISLLSLLYKELKFTNLSAEKVISQIDINNFKLKDNASNNQAFKLSKDLPKINLGYYRFTLVDKKNVYTLKGTGFECYNSEILNEKTFKTNGKLILNEREQLDYLLNMKVDESFVSNTNFEKPQIKLEKVLANIYKYNLSGMFSANMSIGKKDDVPTIDGILDMKDVTFVCEDKKFPKNNLSLNFSGDKVSVDTNLAIDKNTKAHLQGVFVTGKNKSLNLNISSDKIYVKDLLMFAKTISSSMGKSFMNNISAKGYVKANFSVKSDLKHIISSGYLNIVDTTLNLKDNHILLDKINADVDFSNNNVKIKDAKALLNNNPIVISGTINRLANADILVKADDISLNNIIASYKDLKNIQFQSGDLTAVVVVKGELAKITPKVNVSLKNLKLKDLKTNSKILLTKGDINATLAEKITANAELIGFNILPHLQNSILIPRLWLSFEDDIISIQKARLWLDNIGTELTGKASVQNGKVLLDEISISIPNELKVGLKGYAGSSMNIKGNVVLSGALDNISANGIFYIPSVVIPSMSFRMSNSILKIGTKTTFSCEALLISNSLMNFVAEIDNDISKGIVVKNLNFTSGMLNLDTLEPIMRSFSNSATMSIPFSIEAGKAEVTKFKKKNVKCENITSKISFKNNTLYLTQLRGEAFLGQIAGNIVENIKNLNVTARLQGRGLNSKLASIAIMGADYDINGNLDFDSYLSFKSGSETDIKRTLGGNLNFIISNGKMGILGKFEHLIYAQNVISNSILKATINATAKALTVKNTGVYKTMKGQLTFNKGVANINYIKTSGPSMSLYMTGKYYLVPDLANILIMGRVSNDVSDILGPLGNFSVGTALSKINEQESDISLQIKNNSFIADVSQIPPLSVKTHFPSKEFMVIISGEPTRQTSVKSFKWITPLSNTQKQQQTSTPMQSEQNVPDFVKRLPNLK